MCAEKLILSDCIDTYTALTAPFFIFHNYEYVAVDPAAPETRSIVFSYGRRTEIELRSSRGRGELNELEKECCRCCSAAAATGSRPWGDIKHMFRLELNCFEQQIG